MTKDREIWWAEEYFKRRRVDEKNI